MHGNKYIVGKRSQKERNTLINDFSNTLEELNRKKIPNTPDNQKKQTVVFTENTGIVNINISPLD